MLMFAATGREAFDFLGRPHRPRESSNGWLLYSHTGSGRPNATGYLIAINKDQSSIARFATWSHRLVRHGISV